MAPSGCGGLVRTSSRAWKDRSLFERYLHERDPADRQLVIERFLPLARQLAGRYQRAAEPFVDLFRGNPTALSWEHGR